MWLGVIDDAKGTLAAVAIMARGTSGGTAVSWRLWHPLVLAWALPPPIILEKQGRPASPTGRIVSV